MATTTGAERREQLHPAPWPSTCRLAEAPHPGREGPQQAVPQGPTRGGGVLWVPMAPVLPTAGQEPTRATFTGFKLNCLPLVHTLKRSRLGTDNKHCPVSQK